jgi:hypothetical protein
VRLYFFSRFCHHSNTELIGLQLSVYMYYLTAAGLTPGLSLMEPLNNAILSMTASVSVSLRRVPLVFVPINLTNL